MARHAAEIVLTDEEREVLERWARRPKSAQALALRCRIVLGAAEGQQSKEIATAAGLLAQYGRKVAKPVRRASPRRAARRAAPRQTQADR